MSQSESSKALHQQPIGGSHHSKSEIGEAESRQAPIQVTISTFTQHFKIHLPVLFICYDKLKEDLIHNFGKISEKLRSLMIRKRKPYRMFVTTQNSTDDYTFVIEELEKLELPLGGFLIFESNFNDVGGVVIEQHRGDCFVLRANMKKESEFQDGYCRFGAIEVYEILFSPSSLEKMDNVVFDNCKELIRAAKWKGYKTFYLTKDDTLFDRLNTCTNVFDHEDLVFSSEDLTPLSRKIFVSYEKLNQKQHSSQWKLKDTNGREWIATTQIAGYMIDTEEINFCSQFVKVIHNMYKAMSIRIITCELAFLEPSCEFQFDKNVTEKNLLHYLILNDPSMLPITQTQFYEILRTGDVLLEGEIYRVEGLGDLLMLANVFSLNNDMTKLYEHVCIQKSEELGRVAKAYLRDYQVVFNALKEINVKMEYFFDLDSKRKYSILEVGGISFLDMHKRIKTEALTKLGLLMNYIASDEHHKVFSLVTDNELEYLEINKKIVCYNLKLRIENLYGCYEGLEEKIPEKEIERIEINFEPPTSFSGLVDTLLDKKMMVITGDYNSDINLVMRYLRKEVKEQFKYCTVIDCLNLKNEEDFVTQLRQCQKHPSQIVFIKNYHCKGFENGPVMVSSILCNSSKEATSTIVVGIAKKLFPLANNQKFMPPQQADPVIFEIKGTQFSQDTESSQFSEETFELLEAIFQKYTPAHAQTIMDLVKSVPEFKEFLRCPSMLYHVIIVSSLIEKKRVISLNILFKVMLDNWHTFVSNYYGHSTLAGIKNEIPFISIEYFTNAKNIQAVGGAGMFHKNLYIIKKELKKPKSKYESICFLSFEVDTFSFKHEMYAAYLVSEDILTELQNNQSAFECIRLFLSNSMIRQFLIEKIHNLGIQDKIMGIIKQSKYRYLVPGTLTSCGIAVSLLALVRPDLSGEDFAFCEFPNATFEGCNLQDTDFSYANLHNCYFGRANCYETSIFRCKHIGSVQFEEVQEHDLNREVKQIQIHKGKAYLVIENDVQIWEQNLNKMIQKLEITERLRKIKIVDDFLVGYTFENKIQVWGLTKLALLAEVKSSLIVIIDMIATFESIILITNTNCMELWNYRDFLKFQEASPLESKIEKVKDRYMKTTYAIRRVCSMVEGELEFMYIGDCQGTIFKYNRNNFNIICKYNIAKEQEVVSLGFFQGKKIARLLAFTEDLWLKVIHVNGTKFQQVLAIKEFECVKQIGVNEDYFYTLTGHAVSVYRKKDFNKPITKVNYYRNDGLNFVSLFENQQEKELMVVYSKGVVVVPFVSKDINHEVFSHEYTITCLTSTKLPFRATSGDNPMMDVIISSSLDTNISFWDMDTLQILANIKTGCTINQIRVYGKILVCITSHFFILVYCLDTFELIHKLSNHEGVVNCVQIHEGLMISGSNDKFIIRWILDTWEIKEKFLLQEAPTAILCGLEYDEWIVGTEFGKLIWMDHGGFVKHQMIEHKNAVEKIIVRGEKGYSCSSETILTWSVNRREVVTNISIPASTFTTITFYKEYILASVDYSLIILNLDLKELSRYPVHSRKIKCVLYNKETETVYSAGEDRCIKKFDISGGHDHLEFKISMPKRLVLNKVKFN